MLAKDEVLEGRYRIIRQLGHGGMGAVYEAKDERLGSSVALKEIIIELDKIPNASQQEFFRRAFEREAKLLANLHHEAFPRVTDYFSQEDRQFLIMELIYGDDLGEQLNKRQKPFSLEKILKWTEQLLDALDYLHTQNPPTFHRDIKPQNLKVTSRGKIKLLDFGIAKSVDNAASTMTNQTVVGATLNYSPIEQVLPATPTAFRQFIVLKHQTQATAILEQSTDARCDIYAVGATFYHLLTNHVPIDSAQRSLEIWEGNEDPLPNPSELNPNIPPEISKWLLKALEIDRDNRYNSAAEMLESLKSIGLGEKPKNKSAEKTLVLSVEQTLPNREIILTEAKTEQLITAGELQQETESKVMETVPATTEQLIKPVTETQSPETVPPLTDSNFVYTSETQPSGSVSKSELTGTPYFVLEEKKTAPEIAPIGSQPIVEERVKKSALFWAVPMALIGILVVAGVGGLAWMGLSSNGSSASNKSVSNVIVSTPTPTATATPVSTETLTPTPTPTENSREFRNSIGMEFVLIPAGSFMMGSPTSESGRYDDEVQHRVTISKSFYMGKYEVTQGQWKAIMGSNPSAMSDLGQDFFVDNKPVVRVSWEDAQDYIRKLNAQGEGRYRLPTEAEWEYAARAGSNTKYSYGEGEGSLGNYAWYSANSASKTHEVGTKQPNDWGLYDMHGNVWEWCGDWYGAYSSAQTDPTGASTGSGRVYRGGGWNSDAGDLGSAFRNFNSPSGRTFFLGFRLLRSAD